MSTDASLIFRAERSDIRPSLSEVKRPSIPELNALAAHGLKLPAASCGVSQNLISKTSRKQRRTPYKQRGMFIQKAISRQLLRKKRARIPEKWDGHAAGRIVSILTKAVLE